MGYVRDDAHPRNYFTYLDLNDKEKSNLGGFKEMNRSQMLKIVKKKQNGLMNKAYDFPKFDIFE